MMSWLGIRIGSLRKRSTISRNAARIRDCPPSMMRPLGTGDAEVELSVALLVPAEMVGDRERQHLAARLEVFAEIFREAFAGPVFAVLGDDVFEPCVPAVAAVAVIAVQPHHRCRCLEQIPRFNEGDRGGEPRVGLRVVVGHPVAAAEQEIVPGEVLSVEQRDDREIVGQDVDRVVFGDREADLEFSRQISLAIEGVRFWRCALGFLPGRAVDPDS